MILSILKREGKHIISSPLAKTSVLDLILRIHISVKVMGPGLGIKIIIRSCAFMEWEAKLFSTCRKT